MKKLSTKFLLFYPLLFFGFYSSAQQCEVDKESIKGTYTGECKKGKAHGQGKSAGTDTYEGAFKSGLPDGQGTYTWSNGNVFTGKYIKGLREGKGIMTFKMLNVQDSIVEGYWKKDSYIGKYEKPWVIHSKTGSVRDVDVEYTPDNVRRVKIIITNTTGGVKTPSGEKPRYTVGEAIVLKGHYERLTSLESHLKSTETSLMEVTFPLRVKLVMFQEEVDIEFYETGSYTVTIQINQ